jgi:hypothetical protein
MRTDIRRKAVGSAAGLFQGPAFLWGQFSPLVGASIDETAWVRWSALGLTLALVFGLAMLLGDRVGARRLILTVCAGTLAGALLLTIGGAGARHAHAFAIVAVIGSFLQFAATRAGVLVTAHETRGMDADQQLTRSRTLRRWFVIGIYLPSFGAGFLAARYGWVLVYAALSVLYAIALAVLWRSLRADSEARAATVPLAQAIRASLHDPLLVLTGLAAFFAQAVVFGGVQGLPTVLRDHHVDATMIGYAQGSAIAAALLVARPRKLAHAAFGRLVPVVALIGAGIAAAIAAISHNGHARVLIVIVCVAGGLAFITMELLKQWSQSIAQIQAREDAAATHDYVRQALWLLLANVGAIIGAEWIARLAINSLAQWLLAMTIAAALFLVTSLTWYEVHQRNRRHRGRHEASRRRRRPTRPNCHASSRL